MTELFLQLIHLRRQKACFTSHFNGNNHSSVEKIQLIIPSTVLCILVQQVSDIIRFLKQSNLGLQIRTGRQSGRLRSIYCPFVKEYDMHKDSTKYTHIKGLVGKQSTDVWIRIVVFVVRLCQSTPFPLELVCLGRFKHLTEATPSTSSSDLVPLYS